VLDRVHFAPSALCQAVEVSYSKQTIYIRVETKIFVLSFSRKFKKTFLVQTYFRLSMDVKRAIKLKGSKLRSCKKFIVKQPHKREDQDPHFILLDPDPRRKLSRSGQVPNTRYDQQSLYK
jgi:hypothetical protein